ncbi:hypothetical protein D477_006256 [Arthrobacter crystallopoietes BAB-32]|uniref:Uncharacterized protein n=1 Tax=Arthrobacter crystallopoietes BAB-32 TaxID=1246476 RepID=N1V4Y3_9MICC|nr:UPF0158 family protein [Arthrobacter crystallopoietes]EMY35084.1 hypothetical protein D477_006256 [Arthrobacter crystallopoietes BAB-32]
MLKLQEIDMAMLITAMENHDFDFSWWFDPTTGQVEMVGGAVDESLSEEELEERGAVPVETRDSRRGYQDMADFIETVQDEHARTALLHAIERSRPFRRFKDALYEFPQIQDSWHAFHERRTRHFAIRWLEAEGFISSEEAQRELDEP